MSKYYADHILKLRQESQRRFDRLMYVLEIGGNHGVGAMVGIEGMQVRLAVDDFKNILAEIRKLK